MGFFRRKHLGKALLIAPLAIFPATIVAITASMIVSIASGDTEWRGLEYALGTYGGALALTAIGLFYSFLAILVLALPAYLILRKLNFLNIFSLCAVALIPAGVGAFEGTLWEVLFVAYFSLWVAVAFWWLAPMKLSGE